MAQASGGVQRWIARVYERHGSRTLLAVTIAAAFASVVPTVIVAVGCCLRYLDVGFADALPVVALAEAVAALGLFVGLLSSRAPLTTIAAWSHAPKTPELTRRAWEIVQREPRRIVLKAALTIMALECAVMAPVAVTVADAPLYAAGLVGLTVVAAVAADWVLALYLADLALRPLLLDVSARLPDGFTVTAGAWRLRSKALAPIPGVTVFTALTVGAFADLADSGAARFAITYAIALPVAATAAAVLYLVSRSALEPLDELTRATQRVKAGDLETRVPLLTADDLGELAVSFNEMLAGLRERETLAAHVAQQAAELQASRARIVAAGDAARRQVERDLHDGAQQRLVMLRLQLSAARRHLDAGDDRAGEALAAAAEELTRALEELRELAHGIYPAALESDGLPGALEDAAQRCPLPATVACDGAGRYPPALETAVYFCCLEALQNAAKHAGDGAVVRVTLADAGDELRFAVSDDGAGFDVSGDGHGLQNMRDRIGALGGDLQIDSRPGAGTTVRGRVPAPAA
ncbi:MAG TPA: HAMP domain-containing protein [Solirubrobacteraceae bacterium]